MAKKIDLSNIVEQETGVATGRVYGRTEKRAKGRNSAQTTASKEEQKWRGDTMQTQGRKGCKLTRITMAFTPANHTFLRVMAHSTGMTVTQFNNYVIDRFRADHPDVYEKAQGVIDELAKITAGIDGKKEK